MKSSKHIERLFQEGLKDFQASPSPKVWNGIEEHLAHKRKKRIAPLWWRAASVAAILLIFASLGFFYQNASESKTSVSSKENSKFKTPKNSIEVIPTRYRFSSVNGNLSEFENTIESRFAFQLDETSGENLIEPSAKNAVDEISYATTPASPANQLRSRSVTSLSNSRLEPTRYGAKNEKLESKKEDSQKKSLFDAIDEEEQVALEEKESVDKPWVVQPNVAPVFMNSMNGGNPIEPSLQGKTRSNPNVSFGVNVAYAINKKMKIRTGINQVAMGYNTQDVILSTTSSSFRASSTADNQNLKSNVIGEVALLSAGNNRNAAMSGPASESFGEVSAAEFSNVGAINHELGFLEVPLELEYAVIDKKFGLHVLGGASTYLLNNNEIFFEENGQSSNIGEADNLNNLSFSANLGFGMDYNFSEVFSFNLEPKFMYQINTFQNNTSNFQPYFFGIYSGIKFKF